MSTPSFSTPKISQLPKMALLVGAFAALSAVVSFDAHADEAAPAEHGSLLDDPAFEIFLTKTAKHPAPQVAASATNDATPAVSEDSDDDEEASTLNPAQEQRVSHARELLGRYYDRSVVRTGEEIQDVDRFVRDSVRKELPASYRRKHAAKLAKTILDESRKYGFDPVFLMAVIRNESAFQPKVRGTSGEIGLMQLLPATARELARRAKIKWHGKKTLEDPETNVRIGAYYISVLREKLDSHGRLYISAYNMGLKHLRSARARSIWPKDYVQRVMHCYIGYYKEIRDGLQAQHKAAHAAAAKLAAAERESESLTTRFARMLGLSGSKGASASGHAPAAVSAEQQKRLAADETVVAKPAT